MLYVLKNYTIYPSGQTEGILCENGIVEAGEYIDARYLPIRVELPEDLTFELTEEEINEPTEEVEIKVQVLNYLQNFYVKIWE